MAAPPDSSSRRERSRSSSAASRRSRSSETMGLDGGEAGRRAAAEDEYIRRELHQDTTNFCNAFWGSGDAGYEAIQHRMKIGSRTMDDVRAMYKERADIEADYAKRLAKLSKSALGKDETGATRHALDVVRAELDMTSRVHSDLATMVRKDLEGSLADFQSKVQGARKASSAAIEKLYKNKQAQENYVNKSRERYEQDCIKINGYTAQSSLVQGRDLDKVTSKLDKAQSTVAANEKDYQNFVRALKDTTLRWNSEYKAYLDQCQDVEEERLDFIKSNLWNYANAISAVCVADDEGCERVRVALESCDTPTDIVNFIQQRGTGPAIPDAPEYINYAKGQPPPPRPAYHTANFQRNSARVVQPVAPSQPFVPTASAGRTVGGGGGGAPGGGAGGSDNNGGDMSVDRGAGMGGGAALPDIPSVHGDGFGGGPSLLNDDAQPPPPPAAFKPPPGSVGLPGMAAGAGPSRSAENVPPPTTKAERRMSTKNFLARTPSMAKREGGAAGNSSVDSNLSARASAADPQPPSSASSSAPAEDEDPIAKALANLRMRPNAKSPNPATSPLPPTAPAPGAIVGQGRPSSRQQQRPASINAGADRPSSPSPAAAFMQAPARAASPLPVEEVLGSYGQSFPGERRVSRQNSMASARSGGGAGQVPMSPSKSMGSTLGGAPPQRSRSPVPGGDGFAGVGARGRSPSPQPFAGRPASRQQQHKPSNASSATARPQHHHHAQAGGVAPPQRSATPLGISLDASGSVTHDQMAQEFMQRAGSVPPPNATPAPQQQQQHPAYAQSPAQQHQQQPGYSHHHQQQQQQQPPQGAPQHYQQPGQPQQQRPPSSPYYGGPPAAGGYGTPSVPATSSQFTITPSHYAPSPSPAPSHAQAHSAQGSYYGQQQQQQPPPQQQQSHPHYQQQQQPAYGGGAPPFTHQDSSGSLGRASGYEYGGYQGQQQPPQQQQVPPGHHYGHHQPSTSISQSFPTLPTQGGQQQAYGGHPQQQQQPSHGYAPQQPQHLHHASQASSYHPQQQQQPVQQAESPAAAYMHQYQRQSMMQQQQQPPQGPPPAQQQHQAPQQQQQQQQQWGSAARPGSAAASVNNSYAPAQQAAARPPSAAPSSSTSPSAAPTGQYSDLSHKPILFYVKALFDYTAQSDEEFSFTQGDIIAVTQTDADGWWQGELLDEERRERGRNLMPSNFVTLLEG